jgi:hypothetical protein
MRPTITIISIVLLCTDFCFSQQQFDVQLMEMEKSIFLAKDSASKHELLVQKIQYLIESDSIDQKLQREIERVDPNYLSDSLREIFTWNAMLVSFFNKEISLTVYYIESFEKLSNEPSTGFLALKYLTYLEYDSSVAYQIQPILIAKDSIFLGLSCIEEIKEYEIRHKKFKQFASIVPGFGMMLNGNVGKGLISMSLNTATIFAISYLIKGNLIVNSIGWGTNLVTKFYLGNVNLTRKLIDKKELTQKNKLAQTCELKMEEIFNKYPLEFR